MSFQDAWLSLINRPGCYFLYPVQNVGPHPHIILCKTNILPTGLLVVNLTSSPLDKRVGEPWRSEVYLAPGDDKLIDKPSRVVYEDCRLFKKEDIEQNYRQFRGSIKGVIERDDVFERIYKGALNSGEVIRQYKRELRKNYRFAMRMRQND